MKIWIYIILLAAFITSCTKDNFYDSGVSNGRHDCSLLEYLERHSYDWDSTVVLIHHAGEDMVRLFEGNDPDHAEITFFGMTNHSIRRYLLQNGLKRVEDLDPAWCKERLLRHVADGKIYRKDFPSGEQPLGGSFVGEGGAKVTSLAGTEFWGYTERQDYEGIQGIGYLKLYFYSLVPGNSRQLDLASLDIEPNHCVVHSLSYGFTLGDI